MADPGVSVSHFPLSPQRTLYDALPGYIVILCCSNTSETAVDSSSLLYLLRSVEDSQRDKRFDSATISMQSCTRQSVTSSLLVVSHGHYPADITSRQGRSDGPTHGAVPEVQQVLRPTSPLSIIQVQSTASYQSREQTSHRSFHCTCISTPLMSEQASRPAHGAWLSDTAPPLTHTMLNHAVPTGVRAGPTIPCPTWYALSVLALCVLESKSSPPLLALSPSSL